MTHASVFSGIGGPEVAATMLGWENLFHCEINPFGRAVLDYWYPNAKSYDDITKTDFTEWRGRVDVLTGGFPCQPFSYAGQRRGAEDDRYLCPYMFKCIDTIRPTWVVAENVGGILTMGEQGEVSGVATQGACSVRRTLFADTNCERPLPMNESAETLRRTDMRSSRCLYQLVPLEPRTDGTGCSSSEEEETMPMLHTPTAQEPGITNERLVTKDGQPARIGERAYDRETGRLAQVGLSQQVLMLKTPCAMDCSGDTRKSKGVSGTSGTLAQEIASGYATRGRGLEIPMLLPTPLVVEREHPERVEALRATGATKINSRANGEQRPNGIVDFMNFYGMLPTPTATDNPHPTGRIDEHGRQWTENAKASHSMGVADVVTTLANQEQDGSPFRLSPLFTEEMMGFPFLWTTLPFLRPSGAQKPSKPTGMP